MGACSHTARRRVDAHRSSRRQQDTNGGRMSTDTAPCTAHKALSKASGTCDARIAVDRPPCTRSCSGDPENTIGRICADNIEDGHRDVADGLIARSAFALFPMWVQRSPSGSRSMQTCRSWSSMSERRHTAPCIEWNWDLGSTPFLLYVRSVGAISVL